MKSIFLSVMEMTEEKHVFETLFAMAHFFGVKISKGQGACALRNGKRTLKKIGRECSWNRFIEVFPQSVRNLSAEELLFDQARTLF